MRLTKRWFLAVVATGTGDDRTPLIDFTLKDGTVVKDVTVIDSEEVVFLPGMRTFTIRDIASVAAARKRLERIARVHFKGTLVLKGKRLIAEIMGFPEHGMGYSLVDVTLKDGSTIEQVPICDGKTVRFYDSMRTFSEADIKDVAASYV